MIRARRSQKNRAEHLYIPMPNMAGALKNHVHQLKKLGGSKQDTVYFKAWTDIDKHLSHKNSHKFMTSSTVTGRQRKLMQYRHDLLPTNKLLYRYKITDTDNCPLCVDRDGGHHSASGCSELAHVVTLRHNTAGSAIVEAIAQGTSGNQLM